MSAAPTMLLPKLGTSRRYIEVCGILKLSLVLCLNDLHEFARGYGTVVARLLCMQKVGGSTPPISICFSDSEVVITVDFESTIRSSNLRQRI